MVIAGRLSLCFLWTNHPLASSKQVYFMPCSLYINNTQWNLLIFIFPQGQNAVLIQVTNLPTRTTGLHPTNPVVCPPWELFWPVRKITGWRCSLHVGSCYIWTEDFHKSKVNVWPVYSTLHKKAAYTHVQVIWQPLGRTDVHKHVSYNRLVFINWALLH